MFNIKFGKHWITSAKTGHVHHCWIHFGKCVDPKDGLTIFEIILGPIYLVYGKI